MPTESSATRHLLVFTPDLDIAQLIPSLQPEIPKSPRWVPNVPKVAPVAHGATAPGGFELWPPSPLGGHRAIPAPSNVPVSARGVILVFSAGIQQLDDDP